MLSSRASDVEVEVEVVAEAKVVAEMDGVGEVEEEKVVVLQ